MDTGVQPALRIEGMMQRKRMMIIAIATLAVVFTGFTAAASMHKTKVDAADASVVRIDKKAAREISDTTRGFITAAGTFGVDYGTLPNDDTATLYTSYSAYATNGSPMPSTLTPYVTTRFASYAKLLATGLLDQSSPLAGRGEDSLRSDSDASRLTGFAVDGAGIRISDPADSVTTYDANGDPMVKVNASWSTTVSTIANTPGDPGQSGKPREQVSWHHDDKSYRFDDVPVTLVRTGGKWRVSDVGDGGTSTFYGRHAWMLSASNTIEY